MEAGGGGGGGGGRREEGGGTQIGNAGVRRSAVKPSPTTPLHCVFLMCHKTLYDVYDITMQTVIIKLLVLQLNCFYT